MTFLPQGCVLYLCVPTGSVTSWSKVQKVGMRHRAMHRPAHLRQHETDRNDP